MKNVLIYGDSITWGRIPGQPGRFDEKTRYSAVVQNELGDKYHVIAEGLRGRMMFGENPSMPYRDGLVQFGPIFASHLPLDLLVIFLGTNDTNSRAEKAADDIVSALDEYVSTIGYWCDQMEMTKPKLLIIAPPKINEAVLKADSMFTGAEEKAKEFTKLYAQKAIELGVEFFDASRHVIPSNEDGVHLDASNNVNLGKALAQAIKEII